PPLRHTTEFMKTVVVYSGGLDSSVLLYHLREAGHKIHALSVDYGQRHRCEFERASAICDELGIPQPVADLSALQHLLRRPRATSLWSFQPDGACADRKSRLGHTS
ncbi:MAG: 7-cyano-7-deazaguanine synthase, partial [Verrucomicrobiota bacterium]|nr:7-cyano-7-deazaguanine synthase [Verrucomicrobiota bacterium]